MVGPSRTKQVGMDQSCLGAFKGKLEHFSGVIGEHGIFEVFLPGVFVCFLHMLFWDACILFPETNPYCL